MYDMAQVTELTGMSRATVYRKMASEQFPMPERHGNKLYWQHDELVPYLKTNDIAVQFNGRMGYELGRCCEKLVGENNPAAAVEFLMGYAVRTMMSNDSVFPVGWDAIEKVMGKPTTEELLRFFADWTKAKANPEGRFFVVVDGVGKEATTNEIYKMNHADKRCIVMRVLG